MLVSLRARAAGALPGREQAFQASIDEALEHAAAPGSPAVHVMAGLAGHVPQEIALRTYIANLEDAVRRAECIDVQLLIEPLNSLDRPGYLLSSVDQAAELIEQTGMRQLRIMFDCYHVEMQDGGVLDRMCRVWPKIGHTRPRPSRTRSRYLELRALSGWLRSHSHASCPMVLRTRVLQALEMPCSRSMPPLCPGLGASPA